jgi:hypothetical protein
MFINKLSTERLVFAGTFLSDDTPMADETSREFARLLDCKSVDLSPLLVHPWR